MEATRERQPRVGLTCDCEPALNDRQVFGFCRRGCLMLEAVVEDEINQRAMAFIAVYPSSKLA